MVIILSVLLLIIICAVSYTFILGDNNNIDDNSTDFELNKSNDKNISLNKTDNKSLSKSYKNLPSDNNYQDSDKKYSNKYYDEAMEAKRGVEKYVLDKNQIAGYPVYKDPQLDAWLVPIFDKNTKKFVGSVYIYKGGQAFVLGPDSYSDYKDVISGKTIHKSDSNKHEDSDKSNKSKKIVAIGKSNTNTLLDFDLVSDSEYNVNMDSYNALDLENDEIIIDSDTIDNSTCY